MIAAEMEKAMPRERREETQLKHARQTEALAKLREALHGLGMGCFSIYTKGDDTEFVIGTQEHYPHAIMDAALEAAKKIFARWDRAQRALPPEKPQEASR